MSPIPILVARKLIERWHYLHSLPGGTQIAFGVFGGARLLGAVVLGAGPALAYRLVEGAGIGDCLTLTRLWLADELPNNCASRVLGIVLRAMRRYTEVKFVFSYADPSHGHVGTIYQASGWIYTGLSQATPSYDIGDGKARHSRSFSHVFGTRSALHFAAYGVVIRRVPQTPKHRYVYFLDRERRSRLSVPALPYPKKPATEAEKGATP